MYNMDPDKLPSRPVITSQSAAEQQLNEWMSHNSWRTITDCDGSVWSSGIEVIPLPGASGAQSIIWRVTIKLQLSTDCSELTRTGVLDVAEDERLIGILGGDLVAIKIKPIQWHESSIDGVKKTLQEEILKLQNKMQNSNLSGIKRGLVERFIEESRQFGAT